MPVLFLTAHSDPGTVERATRAEAFGYVLKPYEDSDLRTAIEIGLYRHKLEWRLRENEQWLSATLGGIGDGVIRFSIGLEDAIDLRADLAQALDKAATA